MPRSYAPQFRAKVVEQVRSGRSVADVAAPLELPPATVLRKRPGPLVGGDV